MAETIALGPFLLDTEAGVLVHEGHPLPISYRGVRLLLAFAKQPGQVLSKSALINAAWDGAAVEEGNLSVQIASLRKLLGQTPDGQDWIVTVPRVGYRFMGPVNDRTATILPEDSKAVERSGASLAVLPFRNLSDDPAQDYFAEGLVEELITDLSKMSDIFIIARNSTLAYKDQVVDIPEVAAKLGVRYILEGSIRKSADRIRIAGKLLEGKTGALVWADKFQGALQDVFGLQELLADAIVGVLEPTLRHAEMERARNKRPDTLDAYDLYLRALHYAFDSSQNENDEAIRLLEQSIARDPRYAPARAQAAWCYEQRYWRGGFHDEDRKAALEHARVALERGRDNVQALSIAAFVQAILTRDFQRSIDILDPALKANRNSAFAFGFSALMHACNANYDRARGDAWTALRLSPSDPLNYHPQLALATASIGTGNFEEAIRYLTQITQMKPYFSVPYALLAACQMKLGRPDFANDASERLMQILPQFTISDFVRANYFGPTTMEMLGTALANTNLPK